MTGLSALNGATIAFDLDGTLVETAPDLIGAVNAILTAEGCTPLAYGQGRPFISAEHGGCCSGDLRSLEKKNRRPAPPLSSAASSATTVLISQMKASRFQVSSGL
nr:MULTISPECIES: hypothetical protein [unclassified Pannonibacter]